MGVLAVEDIGVFQQKHALKPTTEIEPDRETPALQQKFLIYSSLKPTNDKLLTLLDTPSKTPWLCQVRPIRTLAVMCPASKSHETR